MAAIHSGEFKRRANRTPVEFEGSENDPGIIFPGDGLPRRQVVSDPGIGFSTLNKWVKVVSDDLPRARLRPRLRRTDKPSSRQMR